MAPRDLGDADTRVVADNADLTIERVFDAPRELVWMAMTTPEHVVNWWGLHGTHADIVELDVRPGGRWRIGSRAGVTFGGEFTEVEPPARFVRTSAPEMPGAEEGQGTAEGPPAVETVTFEELGGGRTRMVYHARFPSEQVLDFAIGQGMTKGILEQFARMADLLPTLA